MAPTVKLRSLKAFTLIELLVVVAIIALLISILLPSLARAREQAKLAKCGANLHGIGQAVAACATEHKGYGPDWDDGEVPGAHIRFMYTWVDVLFDEGFLSDWATGICPVDERPDEPTEIRAGPGAWRFNFVREMGVNDEIRYGVRTSFALSGVMNYNDLRDRYEDSSRQVYAIDGWWTWFADLNAQWLALPAENRPSPVDFPHYEGTMVAWRHSTEYAANAVMCDGHVERIIPNLEGYVAGDPPNNPDRTVDTVRYFVWLPGERTTWHLWNESYQGQIPEFRGRVPYYHSNPEDETGYFIYPAAYPLESLSARYKTWRWRVEGKNYWHRLPNPPRDRR